MSRSRRRTPIHGITAATSDKCWKQSASRKQRRKVRSLLKATLDGDRFAGKRWDTDNPWSAPKDGKFWFGSERPDLLRK